MPDVDEINRYLQKRLQSDSLEEVPAVKAAKWLDGAALLRDRKEGLPLRDLLRSGLNRRPGTASQSPIWTMVDLPRFRKTLA